MAIDYTFPPAGTVPEWIKEGGTVAVVQNVRYGYGMSIDKGFVERLTKTQVVLNDGRRFNLKNGLKEMGASTRHAYGPGPLFLADWESKEVKSALRVQFMQNTATQIAQKAREFDKEPTGQKAHELIGLLVRWMHRDGTVLEWGTNATLSGAVIPADSESRARELAKNDGVTLFMRAPGVLAGKWVEVTK